MTNKFENPFGKRERASEGTPSSTAEKLVLRLLDEVGDSGVSIQELNAYVVKNGPMWGYEMDPDVPRPKNANELIERESKTYGIELHDLPLFDSDDVNEAVSTLQNVGLIEVRNRRWCLKKPNKT